MDMEKTLKNLIEQLSDIARLAKNAQNIALESRTMAQTNTHILIDKKVVTLSEYGKYKIMRIRENREREEFYKKISEKEKGKVTKK